MSVTIPLFVCIAGFVMWAIAHSLQTAGSARPSLAFFVEWGRVSYFAGLLVWLAALAGVKLF